MVNDDPTPSLHHMTAVSPVARCPICAQRLPDGADCPRSACRTRRLVQHGTELAVTERARRTRAARIAAGRVEPALAAVRGRFADGQPVIEVMAPFLLRDTVRVPARRRAAFLAHLDDILERAFADDALRLDDSARETFIAHLPAEPAALHATCIACRGTCCTQGAGTHAFLTVDSILFQRHLHPEATPGDLRSCYTDRMPDTAVEDSCVFHGDQGCVLPRDRRANVCNAWQCSARSTLAVALQSAGPDTACIATALDTEHVAQPQHRAPVLRIVTHSAADGFHEYTHLPVPPLTDRRT